MATETRIGLLEEIKRAQMEVRAQVVDQRYPKGTLMSFSQAALEFGVARQTIANWVTYQWLDVKVLGKGMGSKNLVDAYDVACIIAEMGGVKMGRPKKNGVA